MRYAFRMSGAPYRIAGDFASTEPTHCLFCGVDRGGDGTCPQCHAWSGAGPDETPNIGFPCPRCEGESLAPRPFGRAIVKVCAKCRGFFVPALQFSFILNDYLAGVELPIGELPPLPPRPEGTVDPKLAKVTCIACKREMDRLNFASRSDAIIDVCNVHGIWLDAGELVPMLHFAKTRAELGSVPLSDEEKREENEMLRAKLASMAREGRMAAVAARIEWPAAGSSRRWVFLDDLTDFVTAYTKAADGAKRR